MPDAGGTGKDCALNASNYDRAILQLSVESIPELLCFWLTSLCDWCGNLVTLSQPIRSKTETNHDLVGRVFPRFRHFDWLLLELS